MAKNIFIVILLLIVLTVLFLHYRYAKKVNESKDKFITSLLSKLGEEQNGDSILMNAWLQKINNQP